MEQRQDATVQAVVAQAFQRAPFASITHVCPLCQEQFPGTAIIAHGHRCVAEHPDHPAVKAWREERP